MIVAKKKVELRVKKVVKLPLIGICMLPGKIKFMTQKYLSSGAKKSWRKDIIFYRNFTRQQRKKTL